MVYIQSNKDKTHPHHFDCACAMYGAWDSALDIKFVTFEELQEGKYDLYLKKRLFVGSAEFMSEVFKRLNITNAKVPNNSNRIHEKITLEQAWDRAALGEKIFIKPFEIKKFTGFVLDQMQYACLNGLSRDTVVMAYKPFEHKIVSEWRLYVYKNEIIDSRNYSGDFMINPDYHYAKEIVNTNKGAFPVAYTLDMGVLENFENVVIEFNDMWAIGNYGMPNDLYLRLLTHRYFELVK